MINLRLAVVSDLHVGPGARGADLTISSSSTAIDKHYVETFERYARNRRITADYLVVPGDITDGATPDEFKLAASVLSRIAAAICVNERNIIFAPGNHDVDWAVLKLPDATGIRKAQRYAPLMSQPLFSGKSSRRRGTQLGRSGSFEISPYMVTWERENLVALCYNSSYGDDPNLAIHYGDASQELVEHLNQTSVPSDTRVRLFLTHHHLLQYSNPIPQEPDFSVMNNAEHLMSALRRLRYDLVIHGHKHCPKVGTHQLNGSSPVVVFGAGSFSAALDTKWSGLVGNLFHVITVTHRSIGVNLSEA